VFIYTHKVNVSFKAQQFCYVKCYFRATCFDSFWATFRPSNLLTLDMYFKGPEDDSERVKTCSPKIAFYVIKVLYFDWYVVLYVYNSSTFLCKRAPIYRRRYCSVRSVVCLCVCVCVCVCVIGSGLRKNFQQLVPLICQSNSKKIIQIY